MTDWTIGAERAVLELPPITRATLALFAGASGDHNPIHIDTDAAHAAGLPDVIAHGMLVMAYLGRCLTQAAGQRQVEHFSTRFAAMTKVGDAITCRAVVSECFEDAGVAKARLTLAATDQSGEVKLQGAAVVAINQEG